MHKTINTEKYEQLIYWLKCAREEAGLSMRELAERLDVPHSFVQKVEMKERRLDVYEYVQYCTALGIEPHTGINKLM